MWSRTPKCIKRIIHRKYTSKPHWHLLDPYMVLEIVCIKFPGSSLFSGVAVKKISFKLRDIVNDMVSVYYGN